MHVMEGLEPVQKTKDKGRRILKFLLWSVLVLFVLGGLAAYLLYRSAGARPDWYVQPDPAAASQPARDGENKLIQIQTWTGARYAFDYARSTGRRPLVREPESRLAITFTEPEINGMLQKWFAIYGQEPVGGKQVKDLLRDPMVHITPAGITLAATIAEADDRVLSAQLLPTVAADGKLNLAIVAIRSGTLSLPETLWASVRDSLLQDLQGQLPGFSRAAALDRGGGANSELAAAVSITQAIDSLHRRPTTNAFFLPIISEGKALPMRIESIDLQNGSITLTLHTMPPEARQSLHNALPK